MLERCTYVEKEFPAITEIRLVAKDETLLDLITSSDQAPIELGWLWEMIMKKLGFHTEEYFVVWSNETKIRLRTY